MLRALLDPGIVETQAARVFENIRALNRVFYELHPEYGDSGG